jgi:hypothetical protein
MRFLLALSLLLISSVAVLASELSGEWRVDEVATLAQLHASAEVDAQMERELPMLLQQMGPVAYRFEENRFVSSFGERSESVELRVLEQDSSSFHLLTQMRGEPTEIRIEMLSLNQMRIESEHDEELNYLIWYRVDDEGVDMDGLAMR